MIGRIKEETVRLLYHIQIEREEQVQELRKEQEEQPMFSARRWGSIPAGYRWKGQEGWTKRPVPLRKRQKVQEVLR